MSGAQTGVPHSRVRQFDTFQCQLDHALMVSKMQTETLEKIRAAARRYHTRDLIALSMEFAEDMADATKYLKIKFSRYQHRKDKVLKTKSPMSLDNENSCIFHNKA
jgi:hypothetical protein